MAWLVSLACQKAKELGYPHELWTTRLLARHVREHAAGAGHPCLAKIVQGKVCRILTHHAVKPHKVRYYLERRDEAFETKMADVLCVHRKFAVLRESDDAEINVAIISYDESRAFRRSAIPLPTFRRSQGLTQASRATTNTGATVRRACSPGLLDAAYPADTAIKLILDNHSAHISKETTAWIAAQPEDCFCFVFTPKHGLWLNLVEVFFSNMARSMLRHIRVASKAELKARIPAYLDDLNRDPVVHTWTYSIHGNVVLAVDGGLQIDDELEAASRDALRVIAQRNERLDGVQPGA